jgi:uncharacterized membrane protein (DUF485 family)
MNPTDPQRRQTRLGLRLFAVYLVLYVGFVLINAYAPHWMQWTPVAGLNLALLYGFGLILVAFLMALVYGWLSRAPAEEPPEGAAGAGHAASRSAGGG